MATIADTLNDIQKLQADMSSEFEERIEFANSEFVRDLMSFTTTYFFGLLSHATLDALRTHLAPIRHRYAEKYYSMYREGGLLQELIRWDNVSGTFVLWNIFERQIDRTRGLMPGKPERTLQDRYKAILRRLDIDARTYERIVNEFNLIRLTRNSLHGGGIYRNSRTLSYTLCGKSYTLETGRQVTPIRLLDAAQTMWEHFLTMTDASTAHPNRPDPR